LLDPVLERMMEAVHRYEGTVNQVMGDGIMALFGAPLAHEDHAVRACYAALRMQESVSRYADKVQRSQGIPVTIRVGLNSGEVVVRSIGNDLHMDYTAVGQTTHLAARMEQMAKPGSILLSADTLRLAEGFVQVKPLGPVPVKGLEAPIEVYEVTGAGLVRRRLDAAVARGLTRFIGRDAELDQLRKASEQAGQGHGQVVAVVGEPGVGKSRLIYEFTHSHRTHGWLILESGSVSYGKATTYLPVIDLLKAYFQIETRDDARKIREKVTGKLLTLDRALEPMLPAFFSLLDVPVEDPHWQDLDSPQRRQRTLDAVKRLLLRESQVQPLCLVFEDLHWIDSETQVVLDSLIESLPTARLMLLLNYRPEYQHGWGQKTYYTQLRIDPLPPESAEELLQALLGTDTGLKPLKPLLIKQTEGNPFFVEEIVRTLVETHVLVGERGAYRLAKAIQAVQAPATVQAVLAARIDGLPPEEKRLLQEASVIGKDVPFALLQAIVEEPEEPLRRRLAHLQAAEFLYETSLFPDLEYTFKHALTHEVSYGSLLQEQRRILHGRSAAAIEAIYADRLAEHTEALARHYQRSQAWEKALDYLVWAGDKASVAYANESAIAFYTQALEAAARAPSTEGGRVAEIRLKRGATFYSLANLSAATEDLEYALDEARRAGSRRMEGEILYKLAEVYTNRHDDAKALRYCEQALAIAEETGARNVLGGSLVGLSRLHMNRGGLAEAEPFALRAVEEAQAIGDPYLEVVASGQLAFIYRLQGRTDDALVISDRLLTLARQRHYLRLECLSLYRLALVHLDRGEYGRAMAAAEEGRRLGEAHGERFWLPRQLNVLGGIYGELGAYEPAIEQNRKAAEIVQSVGEPMGEVSCNAFLDLARHHAERGEDARATDYLERVWNVARDPASDPWMQWRYRNRLFYMLGRFWLGRGDLGKAWDFAGDSLGLAEQTGAQKNIARSHMLRGEILASKSEPAEAALRFALDVALRTTQRPLVWQIRAALGRLLERQGKSDEAAEAYREAMTAIEALAADVPPGELQTGFLQLDPIQTIRERLDALPRA
ncbi:MAG: AAA family ATPase, partial [Candidatus Methylomirabilia bacterium]